MNDDACDFLRLPSSSFFFLQTRRIGWNGVLARRQATAKPAAVNPLIESLTGHLRVASDIKLTIDAHVAPTADFFGRRPDRQLFFFVFPSLLLLLLQKTTPQSHLAVVTDDRSNSFRLIRHSVCQLVCRRDARGASSSNPPPPVVPHPIG